MKWLVGIGFVSLIPAVALAADLATSGCCSWCPFC